MTDDGRSDQTGFHSTGLADTGNPDEVSVMMARIDRALGRIEAATTPTPADSAQDHVQTALQDTVRASLADLDDLIERLER